MSQTLKNDHAKHIVTKGNLGFAPAGGPLFTVIGSGNAKRLIYNVRPGQLVAYVKDVSGSTIIDTAALDSTHLPRLNIGVGVDTTGDGQTDDVRHVGIEAINGCVPRATSTSSARCGGPEVKDFYFSCTDWDETYSLMVRVDDNMSRSFAPFMKSAAEFTANVVTGNTSCDDCPVDHDEELISKGLANALNGDLELKVAGRAYPDWKGDRKLPRPFFATVLRANSSTYCISPESPADCDQCTHIPAITGVNINGTTYNFVGNVDPADTARSYAGQLDSIVDQINAAFVTELGEHEGSAYATGSYQDCCPIQLHINTSDATFQLLGDAAAVIAPVAPAVDPFASVPFTVGIRVIAEQVKGNCDFFMEYPLSFYGRKVDLLPYGDGWTSGSWMVKDIQAMELPAGFGSMIQWLEYQNLPEGRGRRYSRGNNHQGQLGMPGSKARIRNAVTAECKSNYCSYYLRSLTEKTRLNNQLGNIQVHSYVHVPSSDATTVTAWEAFLTKLIGLNPGCEQLTVVNCDTSFGSC